MKKKSKSKKHQVLSHKEKNAAKTVKNSKIKKIVIASVAALLCIASLIWIVFYTSLSPLERFAAKIARKENFQIDIVLSGIPLVGTASLTYKIDGNIQFTPEGTYIQTMDDKYYQYTENRNGKWTKTEIEESAFSNIQESDIFKQLINFENYEPVEGKKNVYRQKDDVVFEGCRDVVITLEKDSCTITMITLSDGMALETLIVISNVGKIRLSLPAVG